MRNSRRLIGIIALSAVLGVAFAACESEEEKAAKAAQAAADTILPVLQGDDPAAIGEALTAAGPARDAALQLVAAANASPVEDFTYEPNEAGDGIIITNYTGEGGVVIVPSEIDGLPVTELGNYSFAGPIDMGGSTYLGPGDSINAVFLPNTITRIGYNVFRACTNLHTIVIPNGIETVMSGVFYGCGELSNLIIPESVASVTWNEGDPIFGGCDKLPEAVRERLIALGYEGGWNTW